MVRLALGSSTLGDNAQRLLCEVLALAAKRAPPAAAVALLRSALGSLPTLAAGCAGPSESRRGVRLNLAFTRHCFA